MNFLASDPGEDVTMPQTKPVEKPHMTQEQILALIGGIQDLHDLCLMYVGIFCGPRASEVMGLQWKSWTGTTLVPYGTAFEGQFYPGRFKTRASQAPIGVPEQVRPVIEAWKKACSGPLAGGFDVSDFRTRGTDGPGGAALGKELPSLADSSDRPEAGNPGPPRHLSGDAADAWNRPAEARHAQGCARGSSPREHQDDRAMSTCRRSRAVCLAR